ncbi:MAG: ATP-binding protein [Deltaproteobacteria bacterium]|nr:ATP-binding protein [Deltaproteobacteria bacterium]
MVQFHKAERKKSKLRLGIAGPAGSGKTYSALLIAFGIGGKVAMIDTERGSGELYAHLGDYDVCPITSPFVPEKYIEAIRAAEDAGYTTIIIDSLSHAWSGEGGLLDLHGHLADRSGNSWAAWRKVTPKHNQLVEAMLQSPCHIIATMRSKMEYAQVMENGKTAVKKLGMSPIQRDGMEYEFTLFLDIDQDHVAAASKDRTSLFDGKFFKPSTDTGKTLIEWLETGDRPSTPDRPNRPAKPNEPDRPDKPANENGLKTCPDGNSVRVLFAKLGSYGLSRDAYKAYCYQKYGTHSMKELTPSQREEQIKILNSLKTKERLKEFRKVLEEHANSATLPADGSADHESPSEDTGKRAIPPHEMGNMNQPPSTQEFNLF